MSLVLANARWVNFWSRPDRGSCAALCSDPDLLANSFKQAKEGPLWKASPPPSFGALAILAVASANRAQRRLSSNAWLAEPSWLESLGDDSGLLARFGAGPDGFPVWRLRFACRAWDAALEGGASPTKQDLEMAGRAALSDMWAAPGSSWREEGALSPALGFMERLFRAGGSDLALSFAKQANGRNHAMDKAEMLWSEPIMPLWDPLFIGASEHGEEPLWRALSLGEGRLGNKARMLLAQRLWADGSGPLSRDPSLADEFLGICAQHGDGALLGDGAPEGRRWGSPGWGAQVLEHWRARGVELGRGRWGSPDWSWLCTQRLAPFDPHPPEAVGKKLTPGWGGSLAMRAEEFSRLGWLASLGCDASWVGADGLSAFSKMRDSRGYAPMISQFEAKGLKEEVQKCQRLEGGPPSAALRI